MLPASRSFQNLDFSQPSSRTFFINTNSNSISGFTDGLDAVRQAVYLILSTERFKYLIFSRNYGSELESLFGKPTAFVLPEIKRRVSEALLQDSRILSVDDFTFVISRSRVHTAFSVRSIFGDISVEKAVEF